MKKGSALPLLIALVLFIAISSFAVIKYYPSGKPNASKVENKLSELAICTSDSNNNLFPESLNLENKTYPKIGYLDAATSKTIATSQKSELQEYGETGNTLDLKIIWKVKNPESFQDLRSIYDSSKFEKVPLYGEKILVITDSTNKNWQVYGYIPESVFVNFHPKSPGSEPPSRNELISLFKDWFTEVCTKQLEETATLQKTPQLQAWTPYKNDEFGFQFNLPIGWKTHEIPKEERTNGVFIANDQTHAIIVRDYSPKTIEQALDEYKNAKGYEKQEVFTTKIGTTDATILKTNASPVGNNKIANYLLFMIHNGKTLFFEYGSNNNDEQTWNILLKSIKFI